MGKQQSRQAKTLYAGAGNPVMAVVRVKAPAETDPHVLEAALIRAVCGDSEPPMSAEILWLPAWRKKVRSGQRRFGFIAVLCSRVPVHAGELIRGAERAAARALRGRFGEQTSTRMRQASDPRELSAFWCTVRGAPRRPTA
ncbi:hypothetical protein GCM10010464_20660 [Pseudonocardia yunnanensis]